MKKIEIHPEIFLIEDFLSLEECDTYLKRFENEKFEQAKISMFGRQIMRTDVRNNDRFIFFDKALAAQLWERTQSFMNEEFGAYKAIGLNEMFRVYKYTSGQRFKMHRDGSYHRNDKECSFYSFIVYLNDDFKGGETEFRKVSTIIPKKGTVLIFRHPHLHEGKEVLEGIKYVLRTDIMYKLL